MNKYQYRVRVSSKLKCDNRYGLEVNGLTKSKPIYELLILILKSYGEIYTLKQSLYH